MQKFYERYFLEGGGEMPVDIIIDSLTDCLISSEDGKKYNTDFVRIKKTVLHTEAKKLKKEGWLFDWDKPYLDNEEVYGLRISGQDELEGLIAIHHYPSNLYSYVSLVESAPHNRIDKKYIGVGAHLFAIACKLSYEVGNKGFLAFDAKTKLIKHYQEVLGAEPIGGQRMIIDDTHAKILIDKYFKGE